MLNTNHLRITICAGPKPGTTAVVANRLHINLVEGKQVTRSGVVMNVRTWVPRGQWIHVATVVEEIKVSMDRESVRFRGRKSGK